MSLQVLTALLYSWLMHLLPIILGLVILSLVIGTIVFLWEWRTPWKDRAVQRALAEHEQQREAQMHTEKETQEELQRFLTDLDQEELDLFHALRNTTTETQTDLWMQCSESDSEVPSLVLPEAHKVFDAEREGIARGLKHLQSKFERLERGDLEFYQTWLEDLRVRFTAFTLDGANSEFINRKRRTTQVLAETKRDELSRVSEEESHPDWMELVLEGKYELLQVPVEKSRQYEVESRLNVLLQKQHDFSNILHGTTTEAQDDLWMQCGEYGTPVPPLVLPEAHRPFYTELNGINRGLWHLKSQIAQSRAGGSGFLSGVVGGTRISFWYIRAPQRSTLLTTYTV